jgi:signal peptidase I
VVVALLPVALLSVFSPFQAVRLIGNSMSPTLNGGDYLVADKWFFGHVRRGEILLITDPYNPGKEFIKRVVGLPGETIRIVDAAVYVDGRPLAEPYVKEPWTASITSPAVTLPKDGYYVLGDNRDHSSDSRLYGPITAGMIKGVVFERIYPSIGLIR